MIAQSLVNTVISLISFVGLWTLYWWAYRDYQVDSLRQNVFALRDELFDQAAAGLVPFDSPAYGLIRTMMNGSIRFAHRLSFARVAVVMFIYRGKVPTGESEQFSARWARSTQSLAPETVKVLQSYVDRLHMLYLKHIVFNSPLFFPIIVPVFVIGFATIAFPAVLCLLWKRIYSRVMRAMSRPFETLDSIALAFGN